MAGRTTGLWSGEKEDGRGTILRIDRLMRQGPLGIKLGQQHTECLVRCSLVERNGVFVERSDDSVSRKHRRAFHNGRGADSVQRTPLREGQHAELVEFGLAVGGGIRLPALGGAALEFANSYGDAPWIVEEASYL